MTDFPAIRAADGMPSRPDEHLDFSEAKVCSHQAGVVGCRDISHWEVATSHSGGGSEPLDGSCLEDT